MSRIGTLEPIDVQDLDPGDNLLQSAFWAGFKKRYGWRPLAFQDTESGITLLVLTREFKGGMTLAYVPHAPDERLLRSLPAGGQDETPEVHPELLAALISQLSSRISSFLPSRTFMVRFDPRVRVQQSSAGESPQELSRACAAASRCLLPGAVDVQPPTTVLIDIARSEEEILADMKSKWRYNIRLAAKRDVTVRASTGQSFDRDISRWYTLYEETAKRDKIAIHSEDYYRDFIEHAWHRGAGPGVDLLVAEHDGDFIAGIITARMGTRATYVFGASASFKRNLMPAYALQWAAIQRARHAGCTVYDMYGIPPAEDSGHPMHGLYRFKTGFGGSIVTYPGTVDAVMRPVTARAFRSAERLRNFYFKRLKKR